MNDDIELEDKRFWQQMTAILLLAAVIVVGWIIAKHFLQKPDRMDDVEKMPMSHPTFGMIYLASATDMKMVRDSRGNPVPQFPTPLKLGTNEMYWNAPADQSRGPYGILYVWGRFPQPTNMWNVAPCSKHDLADVTSKDLDAEFVSATDEERGRAMFGTNWIGLGPTKSARRALPFKEGDIILMHPPGESNTTYVLEMTRMGEGELRARYLEIRK